MENVGVILSIVFFVLFITGLIISLIGIMNPNAVVRWIPEKNRSRIKVVKSFGTVTLVFLIGFITTFPVVAEDSLQYSPEVTPYSTQYPMSPMVGSTQKIEPDRTTKPVSTSKPNKSNLQTAQPISGFDKTLNVNTISAEIIQVVDGDTMKITFNGKKETIRLLLVDTPETVSPSQPVQPYGPEASDFAKQTLDGQKVEIEIDVSERDKYGRLLCYLYVGGQMFQEMLLEKGLARVAYVYPPNVKYANQFREIQKMAQKKGEGIWSIENYAKEDGFHEELVEGSASNSATNSTSTSSASQSNGASQIKYKNCTEVKLAGKAPLKKGQPGYSPRLDRDGDGIACEK